MTVQSFAFATNTSQEFVVPTGVQTITMECWGAEGGASGVDPLQFWPGQGGYIKGQVTVTPGETLRVYVGQKGTATSTAAFNGGGAGGDANDFGLGGGGATDVRRSPYTLSDRLIVAGGGGGAGAFISVGPPQTIADGWGLGGDGGYPTGADGTARPSSGFSNATYGGKAGTASVGGAHGFGSPATAATDGSLGAGGIGYPSVHTSGAIAEGGGGGGGFYGGGGGGETGAGGGGSSAVISGDLIDHTTGARSGYGAATFTYVVAQPTTITIVNDVPFLQANDRYQVVACVKAGTSTTTSQFRYWYAGAPEWDLALNSDTQYPPFHTLDENSTYPDASVETPFKSLKTGQEDQIQGVYVEFYARPTSIAEATVTSTYSVGFTCRVEGVSTPNYSRTVSTTLTSGIIVSDDQTYTSTAEVHASDTWPNLRTVFLPCRMPGKIRAARVILSDIHLVSIRRVQLMGKLTPGRDA